MHSISSVCMSPGFVPAINIYIYISVLLWQFSPFLCLRLHLQDVQLSWFVIYVVKKGRTTIIWAGKCKTSFDFKIRYGISLIDEFHLLVSNKCIFLPVILIANFNLSSGNAFMV